MTSGYDQRELGTAILEGLISPRVNGRSMAIIQHPKTRHPEVSKSELLGVDALAMDPSCFNVLIMEATFMTAFLSSRKNAFLSQ